MSRLARNTITTTFWGIIGKGAGFMLPFLIAYWFGATSETDVFFLAYGLVIFLTGIFANSVESVIVPFVVELKLKERREIDHFIGNIFGTALTILAVVTTLFIIIAPPLLGAAARLTPDKIKVLAGLLIEISPLIILLTLTSLLCGALNAFEVFWLPALAPAVRAVVTIIVMMAYRSKLGIHSIALGYVAGEAVRLGIILLFIIKKKVFKIIFSFRFDPKVMAFFRIASFQTLALVAGEANIVIDKVMASWLGQGSVSVLHYSERLYMIPASLIGVGFGPVILAYWSEQYCCEGDKTELVRKMRRISISAALAGIVLCAAFFFLSGPLVSLAYGRGKFDASFLPAVRIVFLSFLAGFVPLVMHSLYLRAHLALKNTLLVMKLAILSVVINVSLNYILMRPFGVSGIAMATSINFIIITVLLYLFFPNKQERRS